MVSTALIVFTGWWIEGALRIVTVVRSVAGRILDSESSARRGCWDASESRAYPNRRFVLDQPTVVVFPCIAVGGAFFASSRASERRNAVPSGVWGMGA